MIETVGGPDPGDFDLATVLAALADPVRLAYVQALAAMGAEARCGEVLENSSISVSKSTLSHHLKVLREAGITHTRVAGARRYVSLRRDDLAERFPGLLDAVCGTAALSAFPAR